MFNYNLINWNRELIWYHTLNAVVMPPSIINQNGAVLRAVYCSLLSVPMCFEEIFEQPHHQLRGVGRRWNHLIPLFLILASDSLLLHHCFSLARRPGEDGWHLHFGLLNSAVPCLGSLVIHCSCLDVLCFTAGFLCWGIVGENISGTACASSVRYQNIIPSYIWSI